MGFLSSRARLGELTTHRPRPVAHLRRRMADVMRIGVTFPARRGIRAGFIVAMLSASPALAADPDVRTLSRPARPSTHLRND